MKTITHTALLTDLTQRVEAIHQQAQNAFTNLPDMALSQSPQAGSWSVVQCLDHLNRYARFYLPEMESAIAQFKGATPQPEEPVEFGMLGNKFISMIAPGSKKMKTGKKLDPAATDPSEIITSQAATLKEFLEHQQTLLSRFEQAKHVNLNRVKVRVEVMRMVKFRLGACLEFLVLHEERHLKQALAALHHLEAQTVG